MEPHERRLTAPSGDGGRANAADAELAQLKALRDARVRALLARRAGPGEPHSQRAQVQ